MSEPTTEAIDAFIERWKSSGGHERGAGHQFLIEFCDLLGLDKPDPPVADNALNSYTFERRVDRRKADGTTAPNWIDLYKSGHFVLETKQGVNPRRDKSDPDQPLLPSLPELDAPSTKSAGHGQRGSKAFDKALIRALGPDPSELAARFGKRTKKRLADIQGILATLTALGKL